MSASEIESPPVGPLMPAVPFDAIVEQAIAGIYVMQDECFVYCNRTWAEMCGYTPEEVLGGHLSRFVPAYFLPEVLRLYYKRLQGDPPSIHFVTRGLHRSGRELRIDVHGSRIVYRGRPAVMGVGIDITQRLANEEALSRSREQLRELAAYANRKLEEQRLALARDVHDVLGGMLTSIKLDATRLLRRLEAEELQELTRSLIGLTQKTIDTVKQISESVRPSELDHLDLSVVLARELAEFTERSGTRHVLHAHDATLRLTPKRATAVYRVFHEALTNIARHAAAAHVEVTMQTEGDHLLLRVRDDGTGFDAAADGSQALGLLSMRERAREVGAELTIESAPGAGTRLALRMPLL